MEHIPIHTHIIGLTECQRVLGQGNTNKTNIVLSKGHDDLLCYPNRSSMFPTSNHNFQTISTHKSHIYLLFLISNKIQRWHVLVLLNWKIVVTQGGVLVRGRAWGDFFQKTCQTCLFKAQHISSAAQLCSSATIHHFWGPTNIIPKPCYIWNGKSACKFVEN